MAIWSWPTPSTAPCTPVPVCPCLSPSSSLYSGSTSPPVLSCFGLVPMLRPLPDEPSFLLFSVWMIPNESLKLSSVTHVLWDAFSGAPRIGLMASWHPTLITASPVFPDACVSFPSRSLHFLTCKCGNNGTNLRRALGE